MALISKKPLLLTIFIKQGILNLVWHKATGVKYLLSTDLIKVKLDYKINSYLYNCVQIICIWKEYLILYNCTKKSLKISR